jgi:hypothetical protein
MRIPSPLWFFLAPLWPVFVLGLGLLGIWAIKFIA